MASGLIALPWIIFIGIVVGVVLLSFMIVKWYEDRYEAEKLPTLVATLGLSVGLLTLLLVPVDVYSVSSTINPSTGMRASGITDGVIEARSKAVQIFYYALYCTIFVTSFMVIPFAYFYYEEAGIDVPTKTRIWAGCKYTMFLVAIVVILLIVGLFIKGSKSLKGSDNTQQFVKTLFDSEDRGEATMTFCVSVFSVIGYLCWITYSAYGMSAFPFGFLKGRRRIEEEEFEVKESLISTKEQQRALRSKYLSEGTLSRREEQKKGLLERQEKVLNRRGAKLEESKGCCLKFISILRPFSIVFGIIFLLVSLLLIVSLSITQVDKISNAFATYTLEYPVIRNPVDLMLVACARVFPIDYVVFAGIVFFFFFCTMAGMVGIGIRFFWVKMFDIKRRQTAPQGVLMMAIIIMLSTLALNFNLMTLAPQYASFGTQTFHNYSSGQVQKCSLDAPPGNCTLTQLATLVNRVNLRLGFFGQIFYWGSWVFIAFWLLGLIVCICKKARSNLGAGYEDDSDSDEALYGKKAKFRPREYR